MQDPNMLFARAERSFSARRFDEAAADLTTALRLVGEDPALLHLLALVEKGRGNLSEARQAFERALRLAPADPQMNNNFANLLGKLGEPARAIAHFDRALAAAPAMTDARFNRALTLQKLGRHEEALAELENLIAGNPNEARFRSAQGGLLRQMQRLAEAADAFEAALTLDPARLNALHGRARVAMERGEAGAADLYRKALTLAPHDLDLQLGLAEALEAEGEPGAAEGLAAAVKRHPQWVEGQATLARIRWEAGEGAEFARSFEEAVRAAPQEGDLWFAYASSLAAADLHEAAAGVAARGRGATGDPARLMMLEAIYRSEAGELDRAEKLFQDVPLAAPGMISHYARHLLRTGAFDRAAAILDRARAADPADVTAWALSGLAWRFLDDPRKIWLHEQPGLIATRRLAVSTPQLEAIGACVRDLHRTRAHPIGQSLRGGTQTRGRLFARPEPELRVLREAISAAVEDYWAALPAFDAEHPLLRHRRSSPRLDGSWSVRLTEGGFHVSHVHPGGIVSSACYLALPDTGVEREGWLDIGGPPSELGLPLAPLQLVQPEPGLLALFPSTLYHGTRPFSSGERLTVAFDIVPS